MVLERLGPYRVVQPIGSGGLGTVYRARHEELGRDLALKTLHPGVLLDPEHCARFKREMQIASRLTHPNVVKVIDGGEMDGVHYIAMELVDGRTLGALMMELGRVRWDLSLAIGARVADALGYLHGQGIVHRDVKPANIMVTSGGVVKLLDFGFARVEGGPSITTDGRLVGTHHYIAPELFKGARATPASDFWALGCVLYRLLTGRSIVEADSVPALVRKLFSEEIVAPAALVPELPREVSELTLRLLDRNPDGRLARGPAASAEMSQVLEALAGSPPDGILVDGCFDPGGRSPPDEPRTGVDRSRRRSSRGRRASRRRRTRWRRVLVGLGGLMLVALVAEIWVLSRVAVPAPPPVPSLVRAPPSITVRATLTTFPEHRQMAARIDGTFPGGTRFEVRGGSDVLAAGSRNEQTGVVLFEALPPGRDVQIVAALPGPEPARVLATARTPDPVALRSLNCLPSSSSVLVDFEPARSADLAVEIGHWSDREPKIRRSHRAGEPSFLELVPGLQSDTEHFLTIRPSSGWGGVHRYRFRTLPAGYRSRLRRYIEDGHPYSLEIFTGDGELWNDRDPAVLKPVLARCSQPEWERRLPVSKVLQLARVFRNRELLDAVIPLLERTDDPELLAPMIEACLKTNHPAADELADRHLSRATQGWFLEVCADALGRAGGAVTCDRLAARGESPDCTMSHRFVASLVAADRTRAREHFVRWVASPERRLVEFGILGQVILGERQDLDRLIALVRGPPGAVAFKQAVRALAAVSDPEVRSALLEAYRSNPQSDVLLWANVRQGTPGARVIMQATLERSGAPVARRDAALALGILRGVDVASSVRPLLNDADGQVVQAACWALAMVNDTASAARVLEIALEGPDPQGVAAWCLGQLGHRGAIPGLERMLRVRSKLSAPEDATAACLIAHALCKLKGQRSLETLRELAVREDAVPAVRALAGSLIVGVRPLPGATELLHLPMVPYLRTGIRLCPGDWVDVSAVGAWAWPSGPFVPAARRPSEHRQPGELDLRLTALLGAGRLSIIKSADPHRLVAWATDELVLTPYAECPHPLRQVPLGQVAGLARIVISR